MYEDADRPEPAFRPPAAEALRTDIARVTLMPSRRSFHARLRC